MPRRPLAAMDSRVCVSAIAFCLMLASTAADPDPGRVPKVYNALITSSQNLAPSKSFPLYQPVYEPYSLQFPPGFYYPDHFKSIFGDSSLQPRVGNLAPPQSASAAPAAAGPSAPPSPEAPTPDADRREETPSSTPEEGARPPQQPPQQSPPQPPSTQSPIPLNEFGLPPAIIPLPGRPDEPPTSFAYDPFARFPYYPQFDPYLDPYTFQSYPFLPSVYRFPGQQQPQPSSPQQPSEAPSEEPLPETPSSTSGPTVPPAPSDLDVKNYSKPDASIPDVPPPPIPTGGLKDDAPKTN